MPVHNYDKTPYEITTYGDGSKHYQYRCQDCGLIYLSDTPLEDSDFKDNDYHADEPCEDDIEEDATDDNE